MKKFSDMNKNNASQGGKGPIWIILHMKTFWIAFTFLAGLVLLIGIAEVFIPHDHKPIQKVARETKSSPHVEADVIRIANKFVCGCGDCKKESLTICKCNYAVSERNYIRALVEEKMQEEAIIKTVNEKYGGLKNTI